jgi:hypothetical protein
VGRLQLAVQYSRQKLRTCEILQSKPRHGRTSRFLKDWIQQMVGDKPSNEDTEALNIALVST